MKDKKFYLDANRRPEKYRAWIYVLTCYIIDRNRLPLFNSVGQISNIDGDFVKSYVVAKNSGQLASIALTCWVYSIHYSLINCQSAILANKSADISHILIFTSPMFRIIPI